MSIEFNQTGVKWLNIKITVLNVHDKKNWKKKKSEISKLKFCIIYRVFFVKVSVGGSPGRQDRWEETKVYPGHPHQNRGWNENERTGKTVCRTG